MDEARLEKRMPPVTRISKMKSKLLWLALTCSATIIGIDGNSSAPRRNKSSENIWSASVFTTESLENIAQKSRKLLYPIDDYWKRLQEQVPENVPFNCDDVTSGVKWRSETKPQSVHRLRPGDVDVVAAIGDSISSGNGAREFNIQGFFIEDRGVAFSGGGLGTWRSFTTLPNILKVFNPGLVGYSVGIGDYLSYNAQLNVAIPAAIDDETLYQAKTFVAKMKGHPKVDFESDWKILSILIGHSDLCSLHCFNKTKHSPEAHKYQLQKAIDYLYNNVPRLFVNIISVIDPTITARVKTKRYCDIQRKIVCNCLYHKSSIKEGLYEMSGLVSRYQEAEHQLVHSGRYDGRDDFTVELQTFFRATNGPRNSKEREDGNLIRFLNELQPWTPECFHFNQKGMAFVSVALWKNLMEPSGNKTESFRLLTHRDITCPTKEAPYIFTRKNSIHFYNLGKQ